MLVWSGRKVRETSNALGGVQKGRYLEERFCTGSRVKMDPLISTQGMYSCRYSLFEDKCLSYLEHVITISQGLSSIHSFIHSFIH